MVHKLLATSQFQHYISSLCHKKMKKPTGGQLWHDTSADEIRRAAGAVGGSPTPAKEPTAEKQHDLRKPEDDDANFVDLRGKVIGAVPEQYHDDRMQPPTICVVPGDLATGNIDPYAPTVVCIGPLFDVQREADSMVKLERYKWCCVRKLIVGRRPRAAWKPEVHEPLLRRCLDTMTCLVPRFRASYSISSSTDTIGGEDAVGAVKMLLDPEFSIVDKSKILAQNMLLDGCFILHRLLKMARIAKRRPAGKGYDGDDDDWTQVYGRCGVWGLVTRDLLLLNNQIPMFVVQALVEQLTSDADEGEDVLVDGGLQLFSSLHPRRLQQPSPPISLRDVHHLLHLFYLSITNLPTTTQSSLELTHQWVPCAKELEDAGVRLRARKDGTATSFLDIRFSAGGVLEIPPLQLYDYSEPLFRNLVAFEQTYPGTPGHVTAYAIFMDCLVKTSDDMRLLHHRGILLNHMNGDREAATGFFSRICAGAFASADRNYLAPLMDEVVTYQSGSWPQWRAALLRDYFGSPWAVIAVIVGAVVVALTMLQTFYALYAYYQPPKQS